MAFSRARRGFSRPLRQGQRRATEWIASADINAVASLGGGLSVLQSAILSSVNLDLVPSTIVRTRGFIFVQSDQAAASEQQLGAIGFSVVSEQAAAAGVASVPSPITDETSEMFFLWQPFAFSHGAGTVDSQRGGMVDFDSRAMRKWQDGEAIAVVIENAGTFGIEFWLKFRMLVKLG